MFSGSGLDEQAWSRVQLGSAINIYIYIYIYKIYIIGMSSIRNLASIDIISASVLLWVQVFASYKPMIPAVMTCCRCECRSSYAALGTSLAKQEQWNIGEKSATHIPRSTTTNHFGPTSEAHSRVTVHNVAREWSQKHKGRMQQNISSSCFQDPEKRDVHGILPNIMKGEFGN